MDWLRFPLRNDYIEEIVKIINSTLNDPELEKVIESKIKQWIFDKIDKPGDVTEVVYPFVFSK